MSQPVKNAFFNLCLKYTPSENLVAKMWQEMEKHYSATGRYYHTLLHLEFMLQEYSTIKEQVMEHDPFLFALFYHDLIYNSAKSDNEEKSAALARERLDMLKVPEEKVDLCVSLILATKAHLPSENEDINLFTDIDLAILGADENAYENYAKNVRKEYSIYPDFLYKPGRKKALKHLLSMKGMFKTKAFAKKLEKQARENMERELNAL